MVVSGITVPSNGVGYINAGFQLNRNSVLTQGIEIAVYKANTYCKN